ncbi:putative nucleotidyltransferase, ribonuclease H [Tanacetum coccineum]
MSGVDRFWKKTEHQRVRTEVEERKSYKKEPKVEEPSHKAMMAIDGIGWDWSFMAKENEASENQAPVAKEAVPTKFALMAMSSSSSDNEVLKASQKSGKDKKGVGFDEYRAVPPLLHKSIHLLCQICLGQVYLNLLMTCTDFSRPPPSIDVQEMKPTVKYAEMYRSQRPRGNQRNWNNQKIETNPQDYVKSISTAKADFSGIRRIGCDPYAVSGFTIIDDDDMTKYDVLAMRFCKKYASCQRIMTKFALGDNCLKVDPVKIEAVMNWQAPKSVGEIQSFLDLAGYYRRFIQDFSKIASSLTKLTKNNTLFMWGEEQEKSFVTLRKKLCEAPILVLPEGTEDMVIYSDASYSDLECVLMQQDKVIAYASRQLKKHEENYPTRDLKFTAVVVRLTLELYPGKANVVVDALSRKEREKVTRIRLLRMIVTYGLFYRIKAAQVETLKEENCKSECIPSYIPHLEDDSRGIKTRQWRTCITFRSNVKELLLEEEHKSKCSINPRATKMYLDLKKNYWCPGMKRDCVKCVEKFLTCLKVKAEHQKSYGKVQPLEILVLKWEKITMDFVTKLTRTAKKHDAILVIVDRLTKSAHFIPIRENMPVHKLAKIYVNEIVARHGVPVSIIYDKDGRFTSNFWRDFQEELGTKLHMSTAFHPQTDGQSERTIQTLEDMLRAYVINSGGNRDDHIPLVEFAYNNCYHASIKMPPYEMLYGRRCQTPVCWEEVGSRELASTYVVLAISKKIETIRERLKAAQDRKGLTNESSVITLDDIEIDSELTSREEPVTILRRKSRKLHNKVISLVKVQWKHRKGTSIRWEPKEKMRISYNKSCFVVLGFPQNSTDSAEFYPANPPNPPPPYDKSNEFNKTHKKPEKKPDKSLRAKKTTMTMNHKPKVVMNHGIEDGFDGEESMVVKDNVTEDGLVFEEGLEDKEVRDEEGKKDGVVKGVFGNEPNTNVSVMFHELNSANLSKNSYDSGIIFDSMPEIPPPGNNNVESMRNNRNKFGMSSGVKDFEMHENSSFKKVVSFSNAGQGTNFMGDNKLKLVPCTTKEGRKVMDMDPIIEEGSKKWGLTVAGHFIGFKMSYKEIIGHLKRMWRPYQLDEIIAAGISLDKPEPSRIPLWVKIYNVPLEAWNMEGISRIASRIGTPIIMDKATTSMCERGYGRASFARVLIEVDAAEGIVNSMEIWYTNLNRIMKLRVEYAWKPPICSHCCVFGHGFKRGGVYLGRGGFGSRGRGSFYSRGGFNEVDKEKNKNQDTQVKHIAQKNFSLNNRFSALAEEDDEKYSMKWPQDLQDYYKEKCNGMKEVEIGKVLQNKISILQHDIDLSTSNLESNANKKAEEGVTFKMENNGNSRNQAYVEIYDREFKRGWTDEMIDFYNARVAECGLNENKYFKRMKRNEDIEDEVGGDPSAHAKRTDPKSGIMKKLDRVLGNGDFLDLFGACYAEFLPYIIFDHWPTLLVIPCSIAKRRKSFMFMNYLSDKKEFHQVIKEN